MFTQLGEAPVAYCLLYTPDTVMLHSGTVTAGRNPSLLMCPAVASDPAGLEMSSSALPRAASPVLLGCGKDTPLTHTPLSVGSQGAPRVHLLAICQL